MRIRDLDAVLRPRTPVEAIDLGIALLRRHAGRIALPWLAMLVAMHGLLWALLPDSPWLALLVLWWAKPLLDPVLLAVLGPGLFGARLGGLAALRAALARPALLLASVTVLRFDPLRTFHLPAAYLEHQRGRARATRNARLRSGGIGGGLLLLGSCALFDLVLRLGVLAAFTSIPVPMLGPVGFEGVAGVLKDSVALQPAASTVALLLVSNLVAVGVTEAMFVAGGFALYLDRRTQQEGWHVELAFRLLRERLERQQGSPAAAASRGAARGHGAGGAAALLLGLVLGTAGGIPAQGPTESDGPDPQAAIERVLADPEFATSRTVRRLRWRRDGVEEELVVTEGVSVPDPGAPRIVALTVVLAVLAAAVVLAVLVVRMRGRGERDRRRRDDRPATVAGLDIRPDSLPADVVAEARRRWQAGDPAGCIGLLYRGALADLVHRRDVPVRTSSTEGDCLVLVGRHVADGGLAGFFARLTASWQLVADAPPAPAGTEVDELLDGWARSFAEGGRR